MKHTGSHRTHMLLLAGLVVVALLLGAGLGWALAVAALACGAMLVAVFWIAGTYGAETQVESRDRHEAKRG